MTTIMTIKIRILFILEIQNSFFICIVPIFLLSFSVHSQLFRAYNLGPANSSRVISNGLASPSLSWHTMSLHFGSVNSPCLASGGRAGKSKP